MTQLTRIFAIVLFSLFISVSFAQEKPETEKKEMRKNMNHIHSDSTMNGMHHNMKFDSTNTKMMVHEGEIDLQAIDKNKDGKVFQDQMDWNVISDEPGECPLCGMTLKECTLKEARAKLVKHGYKVVE